MEFRETEIISIFGQRGCGKTTLAKNLLRAFPRCIIFDTLDEYEGEPLFSFDAFSTRMVECIHEKSFALCYKFDLEQENRLEEFNQCLRIIFHYGKITGKTTLVVVEEAHMFASTHMLPHWFRNALLLGRHAHISLLMSTQRPAECNKACISQSSRVFAGRLFEPNDIEYCRAALGDKAKELALLPDREFLYYTLGDTLKRVTNQF
jgi:hypothetical protein